MQPCVQEANIVKLTTTLELTNAQVMKDISDIKENMKIMNEEQKENHKTIVNMIQ
jgi:hypothetical protein